MKYATIVPAAYLGLIEADKYHMALAHLIDTKVENAYTSFYRLQGAREGSYVILDNGVIEGDPRPILELIQKAEIINADEIILPDKLCDMETTLELSYDALQAAEAFKPELKLMAVPQGETLEEWLECARIMLDWDIHCLGIPKVLTKIGGRDARLEVLKELGNRRRGVEVHLLGCWESPLEPLMIDRAVACRAILPVRGIDSSIAYVYAREGLSISQTARPSGAVKFDAKDADLELLSRNIELWKNIIPEGNVLRIL